jgi:hypothetical protein
MQHSDLGEDIEVSEVFGLFLLAIGIVVWRLGDVLSAGVFVPDAVATKAVRDAQLQKRPCGRTQGHDAMKST